MRVWVSLALAAACASCGDAGLPPGDPLPPTTDFVLTGAKILGEKIRERLKNENIKTQTDPPRAIRVTISIGIAVAATIESYDVEKLIAAADANRSLAKHGGGNCTVGSEIDA